MIKLMLFLYAAVSLRFFMAKLIFFHFVMEVGLQKTENIRQVVATKAI